MPGEQCDRMRKTKQCVSNLWGTLGRYRTAEKIKNRRLKKYKNPRAKNDHTAKKWTSVISTWYITTCNMANIYLIYNHLLIEKVNTFFHFIDIHIIYITHWYTRKILHSFFSAVQSKIWQSNFLFFRPSGFGLMDQFDLLSLDIFVEH